MIYQHLKLSCDHTRGGNAHLSLSSLMTELFCFFHQFICRKNNISHKLTLLVNLDSTSGGGLLQFTQVLLLLFGQLQPLSLQTLDHGLPQLSVLPRAEGQILFNKKLNAGT